MKDIKKNHRVHFKRSDIVLCIDIFLLLEETLMLHKKIYLDKIQEFLSYNIKLRNKSSDELYLMKNMNETPIYLNMPASTTVQTNRSKKINIRIQGQENWRITVILTIVVYGEKLTSLLIFKTKEGKDT